MDLLVVVVALEDYWVILSSHDEGSRREVAESIIDGHSLRVGTSARVDSYQIRSIEDIQSTRRN